LAGSITFFVFGGATGATGSSIFTVTLIAATKEIFGSIFAASMIENLIDRAIAFIIAYIILKYIPRRFRSQYSLDGADEFDDAEKFDGV
jgi:energy-coupling factor transport system substrate-specific component